MRRGPPVTRERTRCFEVADGTRRKPTDGKQRAARIAAVSLDDYPPLGSHAGRVPNASLHTIAYFRPKTSDLSELGGIAPLSSDVGPESLIVALDCT